MFGPGLPPAGTHGTLSISVTGVEIWAGAQTRRAPLSQVTLREVGFDTPGLEVAWQDTEGTWAAHVLDAADARRVVVESALRDTPQAAALQRWRKKAHARSTVGRLVLALLVLLPVITLGLFLMQASSAAAWVAMRVPVDQEQALGRMSFAQMRTGLTLTNQGPAYELAQSIVTRLTRNSRFTYEVHIAQEDTPNAFALPGGIIVVHSGLIAATKRPEELAGVLAHEVQHVERRHALRGLVKDLGLRGLWAFAMGDLAGTVGGQAALELTSLQFSRDDEREADQYGFDALVAAGIDPSGMPDFFQTLATMTGGGPGLLSTHPPSEERDRALRQRLATVQAQSFAPLWSGPWPPQ